MIEVLGVPTALEVADAMCKAAQVICVGFENTDLGRITVLIRGPVAEVETAVAAGLVAIRRVNGGELLSVQIIARPHANLEAVLPLGDSQTLVSLGRIDSIIRFPPPLSA